MLKIKQYIVPYNLIFIHPHFFKSWFSSLNCLHPCSTLTFFTTASILRARWSLFPFFSHYILPHSHDINSKITSFSVLSDEFSCPRLIVSLISTSSVLHLEHHLYHKDCTEHINSVMLIRSDPHNFGLPDPDLWCGSAS